MLCRRRRSTPTAFFGPVAGGTQHLLARRTLTIPPWWPRPLPAVNFAEAALLIQGSTCIYSKKVEYLYQLVYETLDLLASKK